MFRKLVLLAAVLSIFTPLFATSVINNPPEDPFPIEENLALYDFSGDESKMASFHFSLLTTDKGDEIYTLFGHSGLELVTPDGVSRTYDWGVFDFGRGFYLNFMRGRLYYLMIVSSYERSIFKSEFEGRRLRSMRLNIPDKAKRDVIAYLNRNALPENSTYLYDFYYDNCATRVRDLYNATTGDDFRLWAESIPTGMTIRELAEECMRSSFVANWTVNFIQGKLIDREANLYEACFLPAYLERAIAQYQGTEPEILVKGRAEKESKANYLYQATLLSVIVALLLFVSFRISRRLWGLLSFVVTLVLTIYSIGLFILMFCSYHWSCFYNENILFINPSMVLLAVISLLTVFRPRTSLSIARKYCIVFASVEIILLLLKIVLHSVFAQANLAVIIPLLVFYLGQAYTLRKE